jgi:hypothetical protein
MRNYEGDLYLGGNINWFDPVLMIGVVRKHAAFWFLRNTMMNSYGPRSMMA